MLDRALASCPYGASAVQQFAVAAAQLPGKSVREVAARVRRMRDGIGQCDDDGGGVRGLAAAAMGAISASCGLEVPGAMGGDPAEGGASGWKDPVAILAGPSSVRATMHPDGPATAPPPSVRPPFLEIPRAMEGGGKS